MASCSGREGISNSISIRTSEFSFALPPPTNRTSILARFIEYDKKLLFAIFSFPCNTCAWLLTQILPFTKFTG